MAEAILTFGPDGLGKGLYTAAIDLSAIGRLSVERVLRIEFDESAQYWQVRDLRGFALFHPPSRQACLEWERRHLAGP